MDAKIAFQALSTVLFLRIPDVGKDQAGVAGKTIENARCLKTTRILEKAR